MGLNSGDGLRAFCEELANDSPAPGGGTASASAGAMAASLLAMVCGVTARNRKYADRAEAMLSLRAELLTLQAKLLDNARLDAEAYDVVVTAARRRREQPGEEADSAYESALKAAADVPMGTAEACSEVLGMGVRIVGSGARSAWSDMGTALLLAEAGFNGAAMNVRVNLDLIRDEVYVKTAMDRVQRLAALSQKRFLEATDKLQKGQK